MYVQQLELLLGLGQRLAGSETIAGLQGKGMLASSMTLCDMAGRAPI